METINPSKYLVRIAAVHYTSLEKKILLSEVSVLSPQAYKSLFPHKV